MLTIGYLLYTSVKCCSTHIPSRDYLEILSSMGLDSKLNAGLRINQAQNYSFLMRGRTTNSCTYAPLTLSPWASLHTCAQRNPRHHVATHQAVLPHGRACSAMMSASAHACLHLLGQPAHISTQSCSCTLRAQSRRIMRTRPSLRPQSLLPPPHPNMHKTPATPSAQFLASHRDCRRPSSHLDRHHRRANPRL